MDYVPDNECSEVLFRLGGDVDESRSPLDSG